MTNQYIEDETKIEATHRGKLPDDWNEKEQRSQFLKSFTDNGLPKQQGMQAFKRFKENTIHAKDLVNLPEGASEGYLMPKQGNVMTLVGTTVKN